MEHTLSLSDYNVEILDSENKEILIVRGKNQDAKLPDNYLPNKLTEPHSLAHFKITLPVFFKQGNKYRLIANQWSYDYVASHPDIKQFLAIVIKNKKIADTINELDAFLIDSLAKSDLADSTPFPASASPKKTDHREKARATGRLCPFCQGKLTEQTRSRKRKKEVIKHNSIVCENKNSPWILCKFTIQLTDAEIGPFRDFKLKTKTWIVRLKGKQCKYCKHDLYLRKSQLAGGIKNQEIVCRKCLINDSPHYSADEFKTDHAKKNDHSAIRLCRAIAGANLNVSLPNGRFGLAWLNKVLSIPNLDFVLKKQGFTIPKHAKPLIEKKDKNQTLFPDNPDTDAQELNLARLNRMLIENIFLGSPKLYQKDGSICKYKGSVKQ